MGTESEESLYRPAREKDRRTLARPYLAAACVELYGCEEGVEDHVARLDVDRGLPLPHRAKVPGRVDEPPEGRHCHERENKGHSARMSICTAG